MVQQYILSGLACPVCAGKIEEKVRTLPTVSSAEIDLMNESLTVEYAPDQDILTVSDLQSLVDAIESGVDVRFPGAVRKADAEPLTAKPRLDAPQRRALLQIGFSFLIFIAGFILAARSAWTSSALFIAAYLIAGFDVILETAGSIRKGDWFNEAFLMTLATVGAFVLGDLAEAAAVMIFFQTGEFLQGLAVSRSRRSISDLMDIRPESANRVVGEEIISVAPEALEIGDEILIRPGERVPIDGAVLSGSSALDTAALTGESLPRDVGTGDLIQAGTINLNGTLRVRVAGRFAESAVMRILNLVENATAKKTKTERFITRFAKIYTPSVIAAAALLAILPPLLTGADWTVWLRRSFVFLVTSCPCALVISIPLSYFAGVGKASASGILFKGTTHLETLRTVDTVAFDKTGTLTEGEFSVAEIIPGGEMTEERLLEMAAYAEADSTHPIAKSILSAYGKEIARARLSGVREIAGQGTRVDVDGKTVLVGNERLMNANGIAIPAADAIGTIVYVAVAGVFAGTIVIRDRLKSDSRRAVADLDAAGVRRTVLVTGDNRKTAQAFAEALGIRDVYAELLPDRKVEIVEKLIAEKTVNGAVVFAGDGINDAPVLARADLGIAMGGAGSEAAIEAADVVILKDEPSKIAEAIRIARRTDRIVRQNVAFSLGGKLVFLVLGALGMTGMWQAVFADVGIMLLAVLNAMRILR